MQQLHQVVAGAEHAYCALNEIAAEPGAADVVEAWRPVMQVVLELCAQDQHGEDPIEREEHFARKLRSAIRQMPHFAFVEVGR